MLIVLGVLVPFLFDHFDNLKKHSGFVHQNLLWKTNQVSNILYWQTRIKF